VNLRTNLSICIFMKKDIHPKYYPNAAITCACGNTFTAGSTLENIKTELCSACHPFYTGKQKLVDTARRVEKFEAKVAAQKDVAKLRVGRKVKRAARASAKAEKKEITVKASKAEKKKQDKK